MFERYTDNAKRVLSQARQEAQKCHHDHIGTEHILLGLLKVKEGLAAYILEHRNIDLKYAKARVKEMVVAHSPEEENAFIALPRTTHAHELIDDAVEEARALKHNYIGTEHLLLALLHEKEGCGAKVLGGLGMKLDDVRKDVLTFSIRSKA